MYAGIRQEGIIWGIILRDYTPVTAPELLDDFAPRALQIVQEKKAYADYVKPLMDGIVAAFALLLCAPLFLLVAMIIKSETPGPVFFRQHRRGLGGRLFRIWKFRTMHDGRSEENYVTKVGDLRITRVGKFLRDSKIDELPQLLNIIMGDMSIIGPRPLSEHESQEIESLGYATNYDGFMHRVRPGLIGLEQIKRQRALTYTERFELNRIYSDQLNAGLDLYIFFVSLVQCRFVCSIAALSAIIECLLLQPL